MRKRRPAVGRLGQSGENRLNKRNLAATHVALRPDDRWGSVLGTGQRPVRPARVDGADVGPTAVVGPLATVQPVEVIPVGGPGSATGRVWSELMARHHPLRAGPLCGAQIRYLIRSATQGWLGGLAFSAAAWRLEARDQWIGWTPAARRQHLQEVVANSRLLIVPHVRVPHLASHVLGQAVRRLPASTQAWSEPSSR